MTSAIAFLCERFIMNITTDVNQTTFGMRQKLKPADIILRKVRNTYPHFSPDNLRYRVKKIYNLSMDLDPLNLSSEPSIQIIEKKNNISINRKLMSCLRKLNDKFNEYRNKLLVNQNKIKFTLENLKNGNKMGNRGEEVDLATIIGKINGQNNIYEGYISGATSRKVSFITKKEVTDGKKIFFKNKEAIIIDPELGIADYAGNYFTKIKDSLVSTLKKKPHMSVTPSNNYVLNEAQIADLKVNYPELIIKDFKPIEL